MKIIITGSNGFLGQHLTEFLNNKGFEIFAISRGENQNKLTKNFNYTSVDLTDSTTLKKVIKEIHPDVIIHNAAMSKPDLCHKNQEECILQNVTVTKNLLDASESVAPYFLYVSTDFVFGEDGPHNEEDAPAPLNFYGNSKLQAENLVRNSGLPYGIMRPVFIYGPAYENMKPTFLHWVKNSLEAKKIIKVVEDQFRTPTYVYDICEGVLGMIEHKLIETIHLAGKEIITPYQMAVTVAKELGLNSDLIEPVNSETFPEIVIRAKKSGLSIEKAKRLLNYNPISFQEGVKKTFAL
jgi:dTDP-4-dehydrorhamnose reductase